MEVWKKLLLFQVNSFIPLYFTALFLMQSRIVEKNPKTMDFLTFILYWTIDN